MTTQVRPSQAQTCPCCNLPKMGQAFAAHGQEARAILHRLALEREATVVDLACLFADRFGMKAKSAERWMVHVLDGRGCHEQRMDELRTFARTLAPYQYGFDEAPRVPVAS